MEDTASRTGASIFSQRMTHNFAQDFFLKKFALEKWVLPGVGSIARSKDETS
jgi:hypothetical protein